MKQLGMILCTHMLCIGCFYFIYPPKLTLVYTVLWDWKLKNIEAGGAAVDVTTLNFLFGFVYCTSGF